jgi:hypothetical protein
MMSFRRLLLQLGPFLFMSWITLATASAPGRDKFQAHTPEEIVTAILAANSSGKTTEIHVLPGDYQFAEIFDSPDGPSVLPPITGTVLLVGNKPNKTRLIGNSSLPPARFINVRQGGSLQVIGISLIGGGAISDCFDGLAPGAGPCRTQGGGAALNAGGQLWFDNCVLSGNVAIRGETRPLGPSDGTGGAILSTGDLHVISTTVSGNVSIRNGAGIAVLGGTATLSNSIVSGNQGGGSPNERGIEGAGLYIENAEVWIDHSTVSGNSNSAQGLHYVSHGLGIFNSSGTVSITDSAVVENTLVASTTDPVDAGAGGGIFNGGTMFIDDSTVAGNTAGTFGGGIANFGKLTLQSVTVARNLVYGVATDGIHFGVGPPYPPGCALVGEPPPPHFAGCIAGGGGIWTDPAATTTVLSTAVALNTLSGSAVNGSFGPDCGGAMISNGYNAVGVATDCQLHVAGGSAPAASDELGVDAKLGDLTDNGEPGNAHVPILSGSPLIDAGGKVFFACTDRDQLGERRTDGDHDGVAECDIGAVEFQRNQGHQKH